MTIENAWLKAIKEKEADCTQADWDRVAETARIRTVTRKENLEYLRDREKRMATENRDLEFVHIRAQLEAAHGKVWTTDELREEFEVVGFLAPYVVAIKEGKKGTLEFTHLPRFYFSWIEDAK